MNCAPEMIKATGYNYPRDWWSVGIIIYHMIGTFESQSQFCYNIFDLTVSILVGDVPFFGNDQMEVFIKILTKQPDYPEYVDNHSKMVIDGLLEKEPKRRFSAGMLFSDSGFYILRWYDFLSSKAFEGDNNHVTEYPCRLIYGPFTFAPKFMIT